MKHEGLPPEVAALVAEQERIKTLPIIASYAVATLGSRTKQGGTVHTASTAMFCGGDLRLARVGDEVRYPDGTIAHITSGAGLAAIFDSKPLAIVGSHISNGDEIVESLNDDFQITIREGMPAAPGLLDPQYVPPQLAR
jgi:uncharacterized Zn-binding protein involved in type VI secretion